MRKGYTQLLSLFRDLGIRYIQLLSLENGSVVGIITAAFSSQRHSPQKHCSMSVDVSSVEVGDYYY